MLTKENQRTSLYKDTVRKQEQVISKLETILEKLLNEKKKGGSDMAKDAKRLKD